MKVYELEVRPSVRRFLKKVPPKDRERIGRRIDSLCNAPLPPDAKKLKGLEVFRLRVGDYRILYEVHDNIYVVLVVRVGHRRDVYKKMEG
jgi:mRNA interferase RelE/StbE